MSKSLLLISSVQIQIEVFNFRQTPFFSPRHKTRSVVLVQLRYRNRGLFFPSAKREGYPIPFIQFQFKTDSSFFLVREDKVVRNTFGLRDQSGYTHRASAC
jgi:hypothetical protein